MIYVNTSAPVTEGRLGKEIFFTALLFFCSWLPAQNGGAHKRILFSSAQINENTADTFQVEKVRIGTNNIHIRKTDGKKITFPLDSVWGIQLKDSTVERIYKGICYKVKDDDGSLSLYYFFSFNLNSPVYSLSKGVVKKVFKDNPCILQRMEKLKWNQWFSDWDKKNKTIRFVVWYNECKS